MQRNRYAVFMAQAGHKVSRFVDFRCVRFQFRFRLAVCVSRLGFTQKIQIKSSQTFDV